MLTFTALKTAITSSTSSNYTKYYAPTLMINVACVEDEKQTTYIISL